MNEHICWVDDTTCEDCGVVKAGTVRTCGYRAFWNGVECDVDADTSYAAQQAAVKVFQRGTRKRVKGSDVTVVLCERDGVAVVHGAGF